MSFLTETVSAEVYYKGKRWKVNPSFDTVLAIQELYEEDDLTDFEKMRQAVSMLLVHPNRAAKLKPGEYKELLNVIYKECINSKRKGPKRKSRVPVLDFSLDGEYIYSSFLLDYGIDLIEEQGRLHWKKFIALFQGLSDKTKIRYVMRIRDMDVPVFNGKNMKEITELQEVKSYYALPVKGGGGQTGLNSLFGMLEGMAVKDE